MHNFNQNALFLFSNKSSEYLYYILVLAFAAHVYGESSAMSKPRFQNDLEILFPLQRN